MWNEVIQFVSEQAPNFGLALWGVVLEMAPYLLLGFAVAGVLSVLVSPTTVERHLGGRGIWPVLKAAAVGVPLPLCSCGVIPVTASLRRHGASRGAATAFLISTPETGVDSIAVTYSLMGWVMAVFRVVAALVGGMLGGIAVDWFDNRKSEGAVPAAAPACADACCSDHPAGGRIRRAFTYAASTLPRDLAKSLLAGLAVAALITALVPPGVFRPYLGQGLGGELLGIAMMMAIGIPMYVCATASVPMAVALIYMGVSPGAAFAFLVTGPATNAATVAMVWKVMGGRAAGIYLGTIAVSAMAGALILDYAMPAGWLVIPPLTHEHHHLAAMSTGEAIVKNVCAVALLALLVVAIVRGKMKEEQVVVDEGVDTRGLDVMHLAVEGMTCSHCAGAVERALRETPAVESAKVDLNTKQAVVTGEDLDEAALRQAVEALGYRIGTINRQHPHGIK